MATLVLQTVGSAIGGAIAGPLGAMAGRALGGLAGAMVDNALFGGGDTKRVEGPRLKDIDGLASSEGAPIPRVYGRARIGGQLIWATRLEEVANTKVERSGSRGGKGLGGPRTETKTYSYFANLAVGLCEGRIAFVRRVWADGRELDLSSVAMRVHRGSNSQAADPLIVAKEGAQNAPAYRGLAYVVFERLPLESFGNRVPQFAFEVVRPVDGLGSMIRGVCLIPGASEFGYDTRAVVQDLGLGRTMPENRHQLRRATDVAASLDALEALCPNLRRVSLVVSWFGDDLRAGSCRIAPRVDGKSKTTIGDAWRVAGLTRTQARAVSRIDGVPAYGGTPSDDAVIRLIRNLKERDLQVVLYPFVMMDVPAGNDLPDPHGGSGQPAHPWRGRITCHPAPGRSGTPDGSAEAGTQVATFFSRGEGYRSMVMHYADLAIAAGGVDGFIIGSEFVGLTRVRSGPGAYPAVEALRSLAGELRAKLGPGPDLVYAADWTEYGAHVIDGGAEVRFPLDRLFAHPAVDAIGIDYYPPLSDWRDGGDHLDLAEARSVHDVDYLRSRLGAGEAFDWSYATPADRAAQRRSPITDGAYGKPWIYRAKDLVSWWSHPHVERVNGIETGPTPWQPRSKPIWLTEIGIPAVDKGPNGPNVFPDPKSSESAYPPHSRGTRDDLVQARALEAILSRFDSSLLGFEGEYNPISDIYGRRMVDAANVYVWAWDARPFPSFPDFEAVWADGANWETGHWLTGRIEGAPVDRLVATILRDFGIALPASLPIDGFLDGYVIDGPMSARGALEPLTRLFGLDVGVEARSLAWRGRGGRRVIDLDPDELVLPERGPALRLVRAQETELPQQVELGFTDGEVEYRRAAVASRRLAGSSRRETRMEAPVVTRRAEAQRLADSWLQDLWAGRESVEFELSPRRVDIVPGDVIALMTEAGRKLHRVTRIAEGPTRKVLARAVEPQVFETPGAADPRPVKSPPPIPGPPHAVVLDLPAAFSEPPGLTYLAAAADPWPGALVLWRSGDGASFTPHRVLDLPAVIGRTLSELPPGPLWRWDRASVLDVEISSGTIPAIGEEAALAGGNVFALLGPDGRWEMLSAMGSEMVGERTFRLARLLRGLAGTEPEAGRAVPAGATIVRLDEALVPLASDIADLNRPFLYRLSPAGTDHADPSAFAFTASAGIEALKPFAPVRASAQRNGGGIRLSWIRRTRIGGDGWETLDVPLGESAERYDVEILRAGTVVRAIAATEPSIRYSAAQELADFGAPQTVLSVRIAQVGAVTGPGFVLAATLAVA